MLIHDHLAILAQFVQHASALRQIERPRVDLQVDGSADDIGVGGRGSGHRGRGGGSSSGGCGRGHLIAIEWLPPG